MKKVHLLEVLVLVGTVAFLCVAFYEMAGEMDLLVDAMRTRCGYSLSSSNVQSSVVSSNSGWNIGPVSAACEDGRVCTRDMLSPDLGFCYSAPYSNATACNSSCFAPAATSGHCHPVSGECVAADATECRGYCTQNDLSNTPSFTGVAGPVTCRDIIPIHSYFQRENVTGRLGAWDLLFRESNGTDCYYGQCVRMGMAVVANLSYGQLHATMGAYMDCADFLDTQNTTYGSPGSCIESRGFTISDHELSQYLDTLINRGLAANPARKPYYPVKFCVYRYACGRYNSTELSIASTSASSIPDSVITESVTEVAQFFGVAPDEDPYAMYRLVSEGARDFLRSVVY